VSRLRAIACIALSLGVVGALAACASAPSPIAMTCTITATADVNPALTGRPSPIPLRVYALKSATTFNTADFITLYQHDQATLATDIVSKDEFTLAPGESKPCSKVLPPEVHFIAVVGAYRDIEHAHWRAVAPIENAKKATVRIQAEALAVTVAVSK
jgi:type VI secretion system protein VasD